MALLTLLTLPLAPVRLTVALAELVRREVEHRRYSPQSLRHRLEALDAALASGELSREEYARAQEDIVQQVLTPTPPAEQAVGAWTEEGRQP